MSYAALQRKERGDSGTENGTRARTAKPESPSESAWAPARATSPFPLGAVQRKVKVGGSGDAAEYEAERAAEHVASGPANSRPTISRLDTVQRYHSCTEEQLQHRPSGTASVQCLSLDESFSSPHLDAAASHAIFSKGSGAPMRQPLRRMLESRMGVDLSGVRVHEGAAAHESATALNARAFTHKSDIWLGRGESQDNTRLMAHEAAHVVQQGAAPTPTGGQTQTTPTPLDSAPATPADAASSPQFSAPSGRVASVSGGAPAPMATAKAPESAAPAKATGGSAAEPESEPVPAEQKRKPAPPESDPAFVSVVHHVQSIAGRQKSLAPATPDSKATEAHAAVVSPASEVPSRAAARHTGEILKQPHPPFNREDFKAALLEQIKDTAPKKLEDADDFATNNNLASVKSDLNSQVASSKKDSEGPLAAKIAETPDASGITPTPHTDLPPSSAGAAPGISASGAAPKPATAEDISLKAGPQEVDQTMADAGVTEEQLQTSNEPDFKSALGQKKDLEKESVAAPVEYRAQEPGLLRAAQAEAQTMAAASVAGIHGVRKGAIGSVGERQEDAKADETQQREKIFNDVQSKYNATETLVKARLAQLDKDVNTEFDVGATQAENVFETYVSYHMEKYKDDRYSSFGGGALWLKDKVFDLPDEVNKFYVKGLRLYLDKMNALIERISIIVETGLNDAEKMISDGKTSIEDYLSSLEPQWQDTASQAREGIQDQFASLEKSVTQKRDDLVRSLTKKYNDNLQKVNDRIEQMKEANRGLVHKVVGAIKGVINAIRRLKDLILNVLSRAAAAIGLIVAHPIRFLGHLVDAGKLGFTRFKDHILKHLKEGFMRWLFGKVAETGIELPENFDLPGIFGLVMQVLGLTYSNIRERAVSILGEKTVQALEGAAEIFKLLITKGPAALWEHLDKEVFTGILAMVIQKIKTYVMEEIVYAGISWLIGLLNPVSAFIKACKAIYEIVMFFVTRGDQILDLVNAIIDSIAPIAEGRIDAAADFIENALARAIPVIIGFLASLLGVGGITEKIQEVIEAIRKPINSAIDWVINKAVDLTKAAGSLVGFGKKETPKKDDPNEEAAKTDDPEHDVKVTAGLLAIDEEDRKRETEGKISREEAEAVAAAVRKSHPIFKTLTVVEGKETWDYDYTASASKRKTGAAKQLRPGDIKPGKPDYGPESRTLGGTSMKVHGLTSKSKDGSTPSTFPGVWERIGGDAHTRNDKRLYVRGHLLNRRLGGPGTVENLTPITYAANAQHFDDVEDKVIETAKKSVVHYEVTVLGPAPAAPPRGVTLKPEERKLSAGLQWKWWELEITGGDAEHPKLEKKKGGKGDHGKVPNVGVGASPHYPQT